MATATASPALLRLHEVVGSLSLATDLGAGVADEAALRTCVLATRLAGRMGLPAAERRDVYYAAVLRYLGCTGFAHESAQVAAGDDLAFLATFEAADVTRLPEIIGLATRRLARGAPALDRVRAVARLLSDPAGGRKLGVAHCAQAVALATHVGLPASVLAVIGQLYERWDGKGVPHGLRGGALTPGARVVVLANVVEIHHRVGGAAAALGVVAARRGTQLDPDLCDVFLAHPAEIMEPLGAGSVWDEYLASEPGEALVLGPEGLGAVAEAFARYVDLKSPFTLGHSVGVAQLAERAAAAAKLPAPEREHLRLAALLHDVGRVSVPNGIWDKPAALNAAEWDRVRLHAYHTDRVLARSAGFASLAAVAASHHERLDGSGYHRGLGVAGLDLPARLLAAADAYHAMTEERAHRPALPAEEAARRLTADARAGRLDREAVEWVLGAAGQAAPRVRGGWPADLSDREAEVLALLAHGRSNKEIGRALFISPRTAQQHVRHIYEKTGVDNRAAAALFAVTHGLA